MKEVWKNIKGYENSYQVSNLGNVKSLKFNKEKILKPINMRGYLVVKLSKEGIETRYYIHRLVAKTFITNPNNKLEVNHINGNKKDNRIGNLEWNTHQENCKHRDDNHLRKAPRGEKHYLYGKHIKFGNQNQKEVLQFDLQGNFIKKWDCIMDIQRELNIKQSNISKCCSGLRNKAGNYIWKYKEVNNEY